MISLPPSLQSNLREQFDKDHNVQSYSFIKPPSLSEIDSALETLEPYKKPASKDEIVEAITKLYALCAPSQDSDATLTLRIAAYLDHLQKYPRDAVLYVLENAPNHHRWFPSWFDLKKDLDRVTQKRKALTTLLEREQFRHRYPTATKFRKGKQGPTKPLRENTNESRV